MSSPKEISAIEYTYNLPETKIAHFPVTPKHDSKLLIYKNGIIEETIFKELDKKLNEDSLLILNNTKVLQARIVFEKETGGKIEIFCLQPAHGNLWHKILNHKKKVELECLIGGFNKWKNGTLTKEIKINSKTIVLKATYLNELPSGKIVQLDWNDDEISLNEILEFAGETPLPPYIQRQSEVADKLFYQTYYALQEGSVAAPTAGLHFTKEVFEGLEKKKIKKLFVTLHVGAGTFKPIKSDLLAEHVMHKEWMCVTQNQLKELLQTKTNKIAVGTTSLRFLESIYWLGVLLLEDKTIELSELKLKQWDAYSKNKNITQTEALNALLKKMENENAEEFYTQTQILIAPGYTFKMTDALITNFHQPNSTLLLIIAAAAGEDWKKIYDYALLNNFRFLSYGDSSLIWINKKN